MHQATEHDDLIIVCLVHVHPLAFAQIIQKNYITCITKYTFSPKSVMILWVVGMIAYLLCHCLLIEKTCSFGNCMKDGLCHGAAWYAAFRPHKVDSQFISSIFQAGGRSLFNMRVVSSLVPRPHRHHNWPRTRQGVACAEVLFIVIIIIMTYCKLSVCICAWHKQEIAMHPYHCITLTVLRTIKT